MKQQLKAFRDNYLAAALVMLLLVVCQGASAQKFSDINNYGFKWQRGAFLKTFSIPSGNDAIAPEDQDRVHLRGKTTDSTLEVWVPSLLRWAKVGGAGGGSFLSSDTTVTNGLPPRIASGFYVKKQLDSSIAGLKYYIVGPDTLGFDLINRTGTTLSRILFGNTYQPPYITKVYAGYGLVSVTDSMPRLDSNMIKTLLGRSIKVTNNGTSGAATWDSATRTLNIPNYASSGGSTGVNSIQLTTSGVLHQNPVNFVGNSGAWTGSLTLNNQPSNTIFAGPATGASTVPTFRSLVAADIPSHPHDASDLRGAIWGSVNDGTVRFNNTSATDTAFLASSALVLRTWLMGNGFQRWNLNSNSAERGSITIGTRNNLPALIFRTAGDTAYTYLGLRSIGGGIAFGSNSGGTEPAASINLFNDGAIGLGKLQFNGTADGTGVAGMFYYDGTTTSFRGHNNDGLRTFVQLDAEGQLPINIGGRNAAYRLDVGGTTDTITARFQHQANSGGIIVSNNNAMSVGRSSGLLLGNGSTVLGPSDRSWDIRNIAVSSTAADLLLRYWTGTAWKDYMRMRALGGTTFLDTVSAPSFRAIPQIISNNLADGQHAYNSATNRPMVGRNGANHSLITADASDNTAMPGNVDIAGNISAGTTSTGANRSLTLSTGKAQLIVTADGVNNAGGVKFTAPFVSGGQGPITFANSNGDLLTLRDTGTLVLNPNSNRRTEFNPNGTHYIGTDNSSWLRGWNFRAVNGTDMGGFSAFGGLNSVTAFYMGTQAAPLVYAVPSTNRVGINNTNPQAGLDLVGTFRSSSFAGTGDRMLVTNSTGDVSTRAIPGVPTYQIINTTGVAISIPAGSTRHYVILESGAANIQFPANTTSAGTVIVIRNATSSAVLISANGPLNDANSSLASIPGNIKWEVLATGTNWKNFY